MYHDLSGLHRGDNDPLSHIPAQPGYSAAPAKPRPADLPPVNSEITPIRPKELKP